MAEAKKSNSSQSLQKQLLRLLQFSQSRQLVLHSMPDALWFEEICDHGAAAKCRISAEALEQGISSGLFVIGPNGALIERPEAEAFRRRVSEPDSPSDDNAFIRQHQHREETSLMDGGRPKSVIRNRSSSPLASLERLKTSDGSAYFAAMLIEAAEALSADFARSQLQPRITARWEPRVEANASGRRNHAADISDSAAEARQRFNRAVSAIGPELSGVVVDVTCFEKGLELIERERQWPARSAKLMLRTGLEILARHYDLQPTQKAKLRAWSDHAR